MLPIFSAQLAEYDSSTTISEENSLCLFLQHKSSQIRIPFALPSADHASLPAPLTVTDFLVLTLISMSELRFLHIFSQFWSPNLGCKDLSWAASARFVVGCLMMPVPTGAL
jgi:hypothetical protein